jgi:uncharacterized membrane protein
VLIPSFGWDIAALIFVSWMWHPLWSLGAADTVEQPRRENPHRAAADGLLLSASIASLVAVGLVLVRAGHSNGLSKVRLVGVSIVLAWSVVHTVYSLRYAKLYYEDREGRWLFAGRADVARRWTRGGGDRAADGVSGADARPF